MNTEQAKISRGKEFIRIAKSIVDLCDNITDDDMIKQINYIQNALYKALEAWIDDKIIARAHVLEDCDPLGRHETLDIEADSELWVKVRDIQSDIINLLEASNE